MSNKNVTPLNSWHEIDWQKVNASVKNLRHRIFVASREGDDKTVKNLQKLMLRSSLHVHHLRGREIEALAYKQLLHETCHHQVTINGTA